MDYDADGKMDIVTGSYTGQFYLFRGLEGGGFAQREVFVDARGATLVMPFDKIYSVVPELIDMDADGDLDLVVGSRSAPVQIVTNTGTRSAPVWSDGMRELKTKSGRAIKGSNAHHADWDGDGVRDLILGGEHGLVVWHRNFGKNDAPRYGEAHILVNPGYSDRAKDGALPKRHGQRVKVHVTDYNGDGKPDLLVGDVTWHRYEAKKKVKKAPSGFAVDLGKQKAKPAKPKVTSHGYVWVYLRK